MILHVCRYLSSQSLLFKGYNYVCFSWVKDFTSYVSIKSGSMWRYLSPCWSPCLRFDISHGKCGHGSSTRLVLTVLLNHMKILVVFATWGKRTRWAFPGNWGPGEAYSLPTGPPVGSSFCSAPRLSFQRHTVHPLPSWGSIFCSRESGINLT